MITVRADHGGGPEHLYRLVKQLPGRFEVFIACPDDKPYRARYADLAGTEKLIEIPHRKFTLDSLLRLKRFAKDNGIQLIHSHGRGAGIYSRLLGKQTGLPVVHTFHGIHLEQYGGLKKTMHTFIEKRLAAITDAIICVSDGEKETALEHGLGGEKQLHVIHNGIELPGQLPAKAVLAPLTVLHVSRFDHAKNTMALLPILSRLKEEDALGKFRFVIAGSGPDEAAFRRTLQDKGLTDAVEMQGFINDLAPVYENADVYLSTSRWEGLPLAVLEAMARGAVPVLSKVRGNQDIVIHNENGFLFDAAQSADAAEFLLRLADSCSLRQDLSQKAYTTVRERFAIGRQVSETQNVYLSVLQKEGAET